MNRWILRQLCAQVVSDIRGCISANLLPTVADPSWGQRAYQVGAVLNGLKTPESAGVILPSGWHLLMTARQNSAAEVLMHLGLLEAVHSALAAPPPTWGDREVAHYTESIAQLERNTREGLNQYLTHLPADEARPFLPLLGESGAAAADAEAAGTPTEKVVRHRIGGRSDAISTAIERAIAETGSDCAATVFAWLTTAAMNGEPPFRGDMSAGSLYWFSSNGPQLLSTNNLRDRLLRRRKKVVAPR